MEASATFFCVEWFISNSRSSFLSPLIEISQVSGSVLDLLPLDITLCVFLKFLLTLLWVTCQGHHYARQSCGHSCVIFTINSCFLTTPGSLNPQNPAELGFLTGFCQSCFSHSQREIQRLWSISMPHHHRKRAPILALKLGPCALSFHPFESCLCN